MTIVVSYSEVFKFQVCKRQYYYRFILGLSPEEESNPMSIGSKGHKLLQNFHLYLNEGKSKEEAHKLTLESAKHIINTQGFADFSILPAWTLVDNYIRDTEFKFKAILIENRFLAPASLLTDDPFFKNISIGFTPDAVFERTSSFQDVVDYKFIQREWSKSKKNRFQQSKLYQVLLNRMGYSISRSYIKFFNVTTASISDFVYTMNKEQERIFIDDFLAGVKEVVQYKTQPQHVFKFTPRTMNYTACGFCSFEYPCTLEADGKSAEKTLETQYIKSKYDYTK